ncbi:SDR family NAD(P)-dependent oxidoreductase [bacterium]|nr:SDR family NAD(P)-dependent oxidoreductase [bacterium]
MRSVAVLDFSCIGPGIKTPEDVWKIVINRKKEFRIMPDVRLPEELYYARGGNIPEKSATRLMALITDWKFDPLHYKISPLSAEHYDIAHWLALDTAEKLLSKFNYLKDVDKERTGVIIGNSITGEFARSFTLKSRFSTINDRLNRALNHFDLDSETKAEISAQFEKDMVSMLPEINEDSLPGGMSNIIAGRIANFFDFRGGAYTVDGACSSSLLSVINACFAIESGDLDFVLCGGVDISLDPFEYVGFSKVGAFAKENILPYDARANGMLPGEGCGLLLLADLKTALNFGFTPKAVIKGFAFSSDGSGEAITAPKAEGQAVALRKTYEKAGYSINSVDYFEGHGTGTARGDAAEIEALLSVMGRKKKEPSFIGSLKANIGHLKAAAGAFSAIKALLALENHFIPPTTGCFIPNSAFGRPPEILQPSMEGRVWLPKNHKRRVSVSAFGFGGSNAHITMEEYIPEDIRKIYPAAKVEPEKSSFIFMVSAATKNALKDEIKKIAKVAKNMSFSEISDFADSYNKSIKSSACKVAIVAYDPSSFQEKCEALLNEIAEKKESFSKAALLFPGQGSQYFGMLAGIFEYFPEEKTYFDKLDAAIKEIIPEGIAQFVLEERWKHSESELSKLDKLITQTKYAQPAIVATTLVILDLLKKYSITNICFAGHSLGEITALCADGIISDTDAVKIAAKRGILMSESTENTGMIALFCDIETAENILKSSKTELAFANINSEKQVVISGAETEIEKLVRLLDILSVGYKKLNVSNAFHSDFMKDAARDFKKFLEKIHFNKKKSSIFSTVYAEESETCDFAGYLSQQILKPVNFLNTIRNMEKSGVRLFIECGPKNVLTSLVSDILKDKNCIAFDNSEKTPQSSLLSVLAALYTNGNVSNESKDLSFDFDSLPKHSFIVNPLEKEPTENKIPDGKTSENDENIYDFALNWIAAKTGFAKETLNIDMNLKYDLGLDSLKGAEFVFALGRKLCPDEIIGSPTLFSESTIREIIETMLADISEKYSDTDLRNDKKALVTTPGVIPDWTGTFEMELCDAPFFKYRKNDSAENTETKIVYLDEIKNSNNFDCLGESISAFSSKIFADLKCFLKDKDPIHSKFRVIFVSRFFDLSGSMNPVAAILKTLRLEYTKGEFLLLSIHEKIDDSIVSLLVQKESSVVSDGKTHVVYDENLNRKTWAAVKRVNEKSNKISELVKEDDLVLVTGGAKGITFEHALALSRILHGRFVVIASTKSENIYKTGSETAKNLARLKENAKEVFYYSCDLSDSAETKKIIEEIIKKHGDFAGILHGAGISNYALFKDMEKSSFDKCLAVKVFSLLNILSVCGTENLKFVHLISSVLAKTGMRMQADYTFANSWLDYLCLLLNKMNVSAKSIGYTVWNETGMGKKDNVLEYLKSVGVVPLSTHDGIEAYKNIINSDSRISVVSGRLAQHLEANLYTESEVFNEAKNVRILRFIPDTEIVTQTKMSINQDNYLLDHVIGGAVVMPVVLLLELLAKNAASIAGKKKLCEIKNIKINSPVIFSDSSPVEIRSFSAVSKNSDNLIVSVIRTSLDGFTNNVVTCEFYYDNLKKTSELVSLPKALKNPIDIEKFIPYPLFHGKFFRHLEKIVSLKENSCAATWKRGEKRSISFSDFKKSATIFPTLIDSMLQTALVMANKLVLPVSIGKIEFFSHKIPESGICLANEKSISLCDDSGRKLIGISDLKVSKIK